MADFGVYFNVTNRTGKALMFDRFISAEGDCCGAAYPPVIPSDSAPHQIHLTDPCFSTGAEGVVVYREDGTGNSMEWYGDCPVGSPDNLARGPGIKWFNATGHPLNVTIDLPPTSK